MIGGGASSTLDGDGVMLHRAASDSNASRCAQDLSTSRFTSRTLYGINLKVCRSKSRRYVPGHKKTTVIYNIIKMQNNQEDEEEVWSTEIDYVALSPPPTPQPPPAWLRRSSSIAPSRSMFVNLIQQDITTNSLFDYYFRNYENKVV
ncbi:unnamed protein product [Spodoptera exigua]|nr:unnamed protein product [Spodoptera exigua]